MVRGKSNYGLTRSTRALQVVQCGRLQPTTDCLVQLSRLAAGARTHRDIKLVLRLSEQRTALVPSS